MKKKLEEVGTLMLLLNKITLAGVREIRVTRIIKSFKLHKLERRMKNLFFRKSIVFVCMQIELF